MKSLRGAFLESSALDCLAKNRVDIFQRLVEGGLDINHSFSGSNAIHEVCRYGYLEFVQYLIASGADINALDWYNRTPLMICIEHDRWECFKLLIENGALFGIEIAQWIREYPDKSLEIKQYINHLIQKLNWDRRKALVFAFSYKLRGKISNNIFRELIKLL